MSTHETVLTRIGLPPRQSSSLWIVGDSIESFQGVAHLIDTLQRRYHRLGVLLSGNDAGLNTWLATRFPACRVLSRPLRNRFCATSYLIRCKVRVVVFLEPMGDASSALLRALQRRSITVVALSARGHVRLKPGPKLTAACEALIELDETALAGPHQGNWYQRAVEPTADLLGEMVGRDLKKLRHGELGRSTIGAALCTISRSPRWRGLLAWRFRRYASLTELREELGYPHAILCLGNGPSSEDPTLTNFRYDTVFRVNHSWLRFRQFVSPHVVFTGSKPTMRAISNAIFCFQAAYQEERFAAIRAFNHRFGQSCFFNAHGMTDRLRTFPWENLRPTNGAAMLAVAVALQPAQLVVAGIDLFQHQDGAYPGDTVTPNAYAASHSRGKELAFLMHLFSEFTGELIIVGDVLRSEWKKFQKERGQF